MDEKTKIVSKFTKESYELEGAVKWVEKAENCQIRAAVNGNFFNKRIYSGPEKPIMIGEVGIGIAGQWKRERLCDKRRWCFGMDEKGTAYGVTWMEKCRRGKREGYEVSPGIEKKYPYGLSNIGVLINKGQPKGPKESRWEPMAPGSPSPRTAVAFSTKPCHFFLVITNSATWDDVVNFFVKELPKLVQNHSLGKNLNIKIQNAFMLDGGGSTQFAYLRKDKR